MSATTVLPADHRARIAVLWTCIALFFLRVIGQVEVLLVAPNWLPPMEQWYSGLAPYPLLLPAQIGLLMLMSCIAVQATLRRSHEQRAGWRRVVRGCALGYFTAMALRLCIQFARGAEDVIAAHGIPIAFHWVLALFLLVLARGRNGRHQTSFAPLASQPETSYGDRDACVSRTGRLSARSRVQRS